MKSIGVDKQENKASKSNEAEKCDQIATKEEKIDFSNVKIEPLFEEEVDFDTFSKSDFRAVKVKECVAVPKSKKLLQFTLDMPVQWKFLLFFRTVCNRLYAIHNFSQ